MNMPITERLAAYLDALPYSMEELARRAGGGLSTWYRIRSQRKGWLAESSVALLTRGLAISEEDLLRIALGTPLYQGMPPEGPPELRELYAAYGTLDAGTQDMVMAMARAALKKRVGAAMQNNAQSA